MPHGLSAGAVASTPCHHVDVRRRGDHTGACGDRRTDRLRRVEDIGATQTVAELALVANDDVVRIEGRAILDRTGGDVIADIQRRLLRIVANAVDKFGGYRHRLRPLVGFHFLLRRAADRTCERQHAEGEHDQRDQHLEQRESATGATSLA